MNGIGNPPETGTAFEWLGRGIEKLRKVKTETAFESLGRGIEKLGKGIEKLGKGMEESPTWIHEKQIAFRKWLKRGIDKVLDPADAEKNTCAAITVTQGPRSKSYPPFNS